MSPPISNIMAEVAKTSHPLPSGINFHDAAEAAALNNNRHATCVDCHSPHASNQTMQFSAPPAAPVTSGRRLESALSTVSRLLTPAVNQYETCLRCHGTSIGKQRLAIYGYAPIRVVSATDPLNVMSGIRVHRDFEPPRNSCEPSPLPQPSLLVNMLTRMGLPSARLVGTQTLLHRLP